MNIEPIQNGVVIDHIEAGRAMQLYKLLNLGSLDASVALIKNVPSKKMGKKDIIKIDADIDLDFDVIGFGQFFGVFFIAFVISGILVVSIRVRAGFFKRPWEHVRVVLHVRVRVFNEFLRKRLIRFKRFLIFFAQHSQPQRVRGKAQIRVVVTQ